MDALPGPERGGALPVALIKAGLRLAGGSDLADAITDLTGLSRRKVGQLVDEAAQAIYDQPGELRNLSGFDRQAAESLVTDLFIGATKGTPSQRREIPVAALSGAETLTNHLENQVGIDVGSRSEGWSDDGRAYYRGLLTAIAGLTVSWYHDDSAARRYATTAAVGQILRDTQVLLTKAELMQDVLDQLTEMLARSTELERAAPAYWATAKETRAVSVAKRSAEILEESNRGVVEASLAAFRSIGRPVQEWAANDLGVHESITVGENGGLTPYILRPHDIDLRQSMAGLRSARMITVSGTSCVGKTRTCFEAVRTSLAGWRLVNPLDADSLVELIHLGIPARTVVWLDELQNFFATSSGVKAARGIRRLVTDSRTPVMLFLGTVWLDNLTALESRPAADQAHLGRGDISALLGETKPDRFLIPDSFSAEELHDASDDSRIQLAVHHAVDGQVTQVLAGGSQLVQRAYGASSAPDAYDAGTRAVILAAGDLRRVGLPGQLPSWAIVGAAIGYLDPAQARWYTSSSWAKETLDHLTVEALSQHRGQRDLHNLGVSAFRPASVAGYVELHDYLLQHHIKVRSDQPTSEQLWRTLTDADNLTKISEEADVLGHDALSRGLFVEAATLLKVASKGGSAWAQDDLIGLLAMWGHPEAGAELRSRADVRPPGDGISYADDWGAQDWLAKVLARRGSDTAVAELETRSEAGDMFARAWLMGLRARQGDTDAEKELGEWADGMIPVADCLAILRVDRGDVADEVNLRTKAVEGDPNAQRRLVGLLARRGDGEAVAELQRCVHAVYPVAAEALIALYQDSSEHFYIDLDSNANFRHLNVPHAYWAEVSAADG